MRIRFSLPCLIFLLAVSIREGDAQNMAVRLDGSQLRVAAPGFHFITGDVLKRLQDGATVNFTFQIGASTTRSGPPQDLVTTRFAVSYDLWEEKYAITRTGTPPRSVSNLSLSNAEKWCLDELTLPTSGLPPDGQFWIALAYRVEDPAPQTPETQSSRLSVSGMIEIFSQRVERQRGIGRKEISGGPYRLSDLRKNR
jgi:hypothetical protein